MTATEYVSLTNFQKLRIALTILGDLKNCSITPRQEVEEIVTKLSKWSDELAGSVKILGK